MPSRNHAPTRPKLYHQHTRSMLSGGEKTDRAKPQHGHAAEYFLGVVGIVVNVMYLIGSIAFLEGFPSWVGKMGDWLFIVGSVVTVIQASWSAHEAYVMWSHPDFLLDESFINQYCKKERLADEVAENLHFVISSVIFFVGALFFMPGIYDDDESEQYGHEAGAWCFIIGSFGFVLASYWNACGLAAEFGQRYAAGSRESRCVRLASISLCFAMVGGVFFVSGSFLYRPGYGKDCSDSRRLPTSLLGSGTALRAFARHRSSGGFLHARRLAADTPAARAADLCLDAAQNGTWLYIIGSSLFLVQSLMSMACTVIMSSAGDGKSSDPLDTSGSHVGSSSKRK